VLGVASVPPKPKTLPAARLKVKFAFPVMVKPCLKGTLFEIK
jgi:hypothetical protein